VPLAPPHSLVRRLRFLLTREAFFLFPQSPLARAVPSPWPLLSRTVLLPLPSVLGFAVVGKKPNKISQSPQNSRHRTQRNTPPPTTTQPQHTNTQRPCGRYRPPLSTEVPPYTNNLIKCENSVLANKRKKPARTLYSSFYDLYTLNYFNQYFLREEDPQLFPFPTNHFIL